MNTHEIDDVIFALIRFIISENSYLQLSEDQKRELLCTERLAFRKELPETRREKLELCNQLIRLSSLTRKSASLSECVLEHDEINFINKVMKN